MSENKKQHSVAFKMYLQLIALLLLGNLVLTQNVGTGSWWKIGGAIPTTPDTWWKTGPVLVLDQSFPTLDSSDLGFGMISSPVSLGTDNFYIVSGPDHLKNIPVGANL
jgi:hypothetical protein